MNKNVASQKVTLLAIDTATNTPKTGDAANLTAYVSKDDGSVTVLGDTSATELDATNAPGLYAFDLTQTETNADKLVFSGKSSTSGIRVIPMTVYTRPANASSLVIANGCVDADVERFAGAAGTFSGGRPEVNTTHLAGTSQTGRDIGASVLLSTGTGTGQLDFTSGVVKANLAQILGSAFTEGAGGRIAAAFKQFFNIASPAATMDHGILVDTATTLTNAPSDSSGVTTLLSRLSALRAGYLDNLSAGAVALASTFTGITSLAQWLGLIAGKQAGNSTARTEVRATGAGSGTYDETTDSQEALRDNVGTNGAALSLAKTTNITGFNDLSAAQVNAEADTALADAGVTTTVTGRIDAAISTRLATSGYTTPPTVGAIADQVWEETLTDHSGTSGSTAAALNAAGSAGDPWGTALPGSYGAGSAGKILGDNLNATVSSRATQASVDTVDDFLDTEIAAIKAKTDNLPAAPAATGDVTSAQTAILAKLPSALVGGRIDASVGAKQVGLALTAQEKLDVNAEADTALSDAGVTSVRQAHLDADISTRATPAQVNTEADQALADVGLTSTVTGRVDVAVSTRLAAGTVASDVTGIKAKTDNLPSDPADASEIAASFSTVNSALATIAAFVDTEVAAIKLVTDKFDAAQAEPTAAPAANATPLEKIAWLAMLARNKIVQTNTQQTVRNDGDSADVATALVSDDGSETIRGEYA